ncbi:MAG: hypothetical protein R8K46_11005 [Mariprofundaceae bacterium]
MSHTTLIQVASNIGDSTRRQMARLYLANYNGSDEVQFNRDLMDKDEAVIVHKEGQLIGFSTFKIYNRTWNSEPIRVLYSGDTIMDRNHWGKQSLAFAWIQRMGEIKRQHPDTPFYWFLLTKGHRTFRYMPAFGKSFFPHWLNHRDDLKSLADILASEKFGADYNAATGVVEFPRSRGHLKPDLAEPSPTDQAKESVRFFLKCNPGYRQGHELACICEMEEYNMKPLAKRLFRKPLNESSRMA